MQNDQTIRIRARMIRDKLLACNNAPNFRLVLESMTDAELLEAHEAHHRTKMDAVREKESAAA